MRKYCKFNVSWLLKQKEKLSQRPRKKNQNWSNLLEKKQKRRLTRSSLNNIHSSHEELDEELYDDIDDHLDIYKEKFIKSTLNKTMCYVKQNWNNYQPYVLV